MLAVGNSKATLDQLRWAKFYAGVMHSGQTYSGLPYTHHLAAVEAVARRFRPNISIEFLEACWLHDVIEDTDTKYKDVFEMFGEHVANLVIAVTNAPGENRKIRAALTYPKILAGPPGSVMLKLCDRIANVEAGGKLVSMYRSEYDSFRRGLYTAGGWEDMWDHLDSLLK